MNPNQNSYPNASPPSYSSLFNDDQRNDDFNPYGNQIYPKPSQERRSDFDAFMRHYEISPSFSEKLYQLRGYEIVFICDDSGSMNAPVGEDINPYGKQKTRWDELKQTVSIVVDLASILDPDGVDVYFLNREPMFHVRNAAELENIFVVEPEGATPLVPVLRQVLQDKRNQIYERKLLILIATDGIPTDERERPDIRTLEHVLRSERNPSALIPVTIIACTDDEQCIGYLNNWDKNIPNLDVVDDYRSERKEVQACRGKHTPFTFGDYIVKILLGGIDRSIDDWDEAI